MTFRAKTLAVALSLAAASMLASAAPAGAVARVQASAPPADVAALQSQIQAAVVATQAGFTANESDRDKEAALQAAMGAAIAASGFDAVTAQAALMAIANNTTLVGQAATALLATVSPLAQQEIAQANAVGGGGGSPGAGGGFGGSGGGAGGGGGYVVSQ
jgi:hypothetical protein